MMSHPHWLKGDRWMDGRGGGGWGWLTFGIANGSVSISYYNYIFLLKIIFCYIMNYVNLLNSIFVLLFLKRIVFTVYP